MTVPVESHADVAQTRTDASNAWGGLRVAVTGGTSGLGLALVREFRRRGARVAFVARGAERVERVAREFASHGIVGDVARKEDIHPIALQIVGELGGLDVLVNNAGMTHFIAHPDLSAVTDAVWDEIFQVNVKGAFYCCRAAMPLLKERHGSIVNVSSVAGLTGQGSSIPYCASKAAMNCLTQSLARAFGPEVRVNAVAPGPILTRWLAGREAQVEKYLEQAPLKRAADPDDVADAVVYLATGTALTTGQVLVVDGGRTM